MKKVVRSHIASKSRIKKLLDRVTEWKATCQRQVHRMAEPYESSAIENNPESNRLLTVTDVVEESFRIWFEPGTHLKLSTDRIEYLERLIEDLEITTRDSSGQFLDRLHGVLLRYNFNAREYCLAYIDGINERIKAKHTIEEKIDVLYIQLKVIYQLQCERGMMYYDLYPSVKGFIGTWITEEICFAERKIIRQDDERFSGEEFSDSGKTSKLITNMSVATLACLIKAFVETGIIRNTNVTELSLIMTRIFVSKRSENVSPRSFRLRYYDIEDATRDSVVELLKNTSRFIKDLEA